MNFIKVFVIILTINSIFSSLSFAENPKLFESNFKFNASLPLEITSDQLTVEQNIGHAIFTGNVMANQGDLILTAGEVIVEYQVTDSRMTSNMQKLNASKEVTIISATQSAEASSLIYDIIGETIVMTGNVLLKEGVSATSGDKLTINLKSGSRRMEGNVRTLIISEEKNE
jgi:lipopolysaccharide export system protein LptA